MHISKYFQLSPFLCTFLVVNLPLLPAKNFHTTSSSILVDPEILTMPSSSVFITMINKTAPVLNQLNFVQFATESEKAFATVEALKAHSLATQEPLQEFLTVAGVNFKSFWISNQIYIKDAFPEIVTTLMELFPGEISQVSREIVIEMLPTFNEKKGVRPTADSTEWGCEMLGAPAAWKEGRKGQGVIVGVLDTGVLGDHEQLDGKILTFHDALTGLGFMHDLNGHGTHVCGTIVGNTVGMASKAKIVFCKCCDTAGCTQDALLECGQHITCPDPPTCSLRPHVISCSWGGDGGQDFYMDTVNTWRHLNIFPVFAAGNSGPGCETCGSPGDYSTVVSVAAMDIHRKIGSFSSRGPAKISPKTNLKPEVTGPGVDIKSCSHLSTTAYKVMSGTSMACPHIAGLAALLLSNGTIMSYDQLLDAMKSSCSHDLGSTRANCGGVSDKGFPNFVYGHGKPNCGKAIQFIEQQKQTEKAHEKSKSERINIIRSEDDRKHNLEFDDFENNDAGQVFDDFDTENIEKRDVVEVESFEVNESKEGEDLL